MPVGKYKTFGECVGAQKKMGKDDLSARKICGTIEKKTQEGLKRQGSSNVKYEDANNRLYIKAFLLDASVNINEWGIAPNSLDKQINTFIGKPLVLTEDFRHPMPPDSQRVGDSDEYYDDDDDPTNTVHVDEIVDHWLQYQEAYRVGSIVDITFKNGIYYAIIEVTDAAAKEAFRNNDLPLFVSPAIAQLNPYENASNITNWTGIHLAIVSNPAYTIKKAIISGQCHENGQESGKCLLQLRQAAIEDKKIPRIGCGFCRTKALQRYAEIVKPFVSHLTYTWQPKAQDVDEFLNSSFRLSNTHLKTELTDQQTNNNNTTTDTNKPQEFEQKQNEQGGDLGEQNQKGNGTPKETIKTEKETEETTTVTKEAAEVGLRVAGMQECINIFQQNGVDPNQAGQICKLAAQALMDNQNQQQQPGGGAQGGGPPKSPGQFGSVNEFDKLLAKKDLQIEKLSEELKHFKKNDKSDAQRIAELEDQLNNLNLQLKEKELDSYLATKITDVEARTAKVKKFAGLNLSLDDVKEIFEDFTPSSATTTPPGNTGQKVAVKKTAEVIEQSPIAKPAGKVKLQTASTNEGETETQTKSGNEIRERNNRILSSLLQKGGIY